MKRKRTSGVGVAVAIVALALAGLALLLVGCAQYTVLRYPRPGAELRVYAPGARVDSNTCAGRQAEVDAVFALLDRALDDLKLATPGRWGTAPISVCVVEAHPLVLCGGAPLAGCSYPSGAVFVATVWTPPGGLPTPGYDYRRTLLHELVGLLAMRGGLVGVAAGQGAAWEAALTKSAPYAALTKAVRW